MTTNITKIETSRHYLPSDKNMLCHIKDHLAKTSDQNLEVPELAMNL